MNHYLRSGELSVTIKDQGAEVCSVKDQEGVEYMWQAEQAVWPRHAPVLFPVVGRLKNDEYTFEGRSYKMSQHGFARDMNFTCVSETTGELGFELKSTEKTREVYPFDFILRIHYSLEGNVLKTRYTVHNPGSGELFFSIGAHPGFRCPLMPDEQFSDYYLEFGHDTLMQTGLSEGLRNGQTRITPLTGKKLFLSSELFNEDALVFENHQINSLSLVSRLSGKGIMVRSEGWPYFGVWSKKGCTSFVCLEPWHGIADSTQSSGNLSEKEGILRLLPGADFSCAYDTVFGQVC